MKNLLFVFSFLLLGLCACDHIEPVGDVGGDIDFRAQNRTAFWGWDETLDTFVLKIIYGPTPAVASRVTYTIQAAGYYSGWGDCEGYGLDIGEEPWWWSLYSCYPGIYGSEQRASGVSTTKVYTKDLSCTCNHEECWYCQFNSCNGPNPGCWVLIVSFQKWNGSNWVNDGRLECYSAGSPVSFCE